MRTARLAVLLLVLGSLCTFAEGQPEAIQQAEDALRAREYARAQTLLGPVTGAEGANDYALFLLGNAHFHAKQYPEAVQVYDRLLKDFADSPWRKKALFKKADALTQQKQFGQAADLLQPEVEHLVSDARKEEVAASYLKYADAYFTGTQEDRRQPVGSPAAPRETNRLTPTLQPDYEKARSLFEKALELGLTPEKTAQTKLRVARCWYEAGQFGNAAQQLQGLLKEHPDAKVLPDAKYYLGMAHLRSGNMRQARNALRDFQEDYPQSALLPDVLFALCESYHVPTPQNDRELDLGVKALREFVAKFGKHDKAIVADYLIGASYFNRGRYEDAVAELTGFSKRWSKSGKDELPQASNLVGMALVAQKRHREALDTWNQFLTKFTNHRLWNQVQRQILDTEYLIGDEAYRAKKYGDALKAWDAFQAKYPLDVRNPDIMFMRGMIQHDQEKYPETLAEWAKLTSKHPETEAAARAWLLTGDVYETKTLEFEKAIEAYGKVTQGQWQAEAQQRLAALKQKKLVLYTERTLTTANGRRSSADEPKLKVVTRNVEELEFRGYRVDMVDYFNRLHTVAGVEKLDLALIEPDRKWTLKVPGYAQYKEVETEATLPFKEPGVYAVTCSADSLEATTVVMVTDLNLITKVTRKDALVFAENVREKKPFTGATVVLSNGEKILATGETNGDGVYQVGLETLKDASNLRVLAYSGSHYASTTSDLSKLKIVPGLEPRGLLYTDRPTYRPGHTVRLRGILRKAEAGEYVFTEGDAFDLTVTSPAGVVVHQGQVKLSAFGTFADQLDLPADAVTGEYTITVKDAPEGESTGSAPAATGDAPFTFTGKFSVLEYKLERVRLDLELPKWTYLRGDEIKGKAVAKYYYGEPLAGRKVRFGWDQEPGQEYETGADGSFEFTVTTRRFDEEQTVTLWARLEEESIAARERVYIAPVAIRASLTMVRDVFLVKEPFEVEVKTTDLAAKPVPMKMQLRLLKREKDETGRVGEREVRGMGVQTDQDGSAKARVEFADSGDYVLRLQGTDERQDPFSVEKYVQIVGDDDEVKLRILADTDTYKVGETPKIKLVSRTEPQLCLLTYEGDRIYGYQVALLAKGLNEVAVPMTAKLAPKFALGAGMMDGDKFHAASKVFNVERELKVTLSPDKPKHLPKDKAKVTVKVADQNGKPVAAELSLAAVNASLYAVMADPTPNLGDFFYQRPFVERAVAGATSCTFNYSAQAKGVELQIRDARRDLNLALGRYYSWHAPAERQQVDRGGRSTYGTGMAGGMGGGGFGSFSGYGGGFGSGQLFELPPGVEAVGAYNPLNAVLVQGRNGEPGAAGPPTAARAPSRPAGGAVAGKPVEHAAEAEQQVVALADMPLLGALFGEREKGGEAEVRTAFGETAFWDAHVVTADDGTATVEFTVPDSITEWRLTGRGVTTTTLVGQAIASVVSAKPFLAELKTPTLLQQGDTVYLVAEVHNNTDASVKAAVVLGCEIGRKAEQSKQEAEVPAHSQREVLFRIEVGDGREAKLTLTARAGDGMTDASEHTVPIRPWGIEFVDSIGGTADTNRTVTLQLPEHPYTTRDLEITVGPSIERAVIDAARQQPVRCFSIASSVPARALSMAAAARYLRQLGRGETPECRSLEAGLAGLVTRLVATRNEGGGWSWAQSQRTPLEDAQQDQSDVFVTSQAASALAQAKALGISVPPKPLANAKAFLQNQFQAAAESDFERKLAILDAQAQSGEADFAHVNRVYRVRNQLDARGLAVLMQILARMERTGTAKELEDALIAKLKRGEGKAFAPASNQELRFGGDEVETTAHALLALAMVDPQSKLLPELAEWLWTRRVGVAWATDQASAAAVQALAYYTALAKRATDRYTLAIAANGTEVRKLEVDGGTTTVTVPVPRDLVTGNEAKVSFAVEGRGQYTYSCVLRGFSSEVEEHDAGLEVERSYVHPPVTLDGKPMPRGFSTVGIDKEWTNYAKEIAAGNYTEVSVNWHKRLRDFNPGSYVVLREPLPAGCQPLTQSITGNFERYEIGDGELVFYFHTRGESWPSGSANYQLYGRLPGSYRGLPARVWSYYQPDLYAYSKPSDLRVLERGRKSGDEYRLTPDEVYNLGKAYFERDNFKDAEARLAPYYDQFKLRDEPSKETARMLFYCYLDQEKHDKVVRFFEVLNERHPTLVIPFSDIVAVARAYKAIDERERQMQVYRATAAASFDRESRVAGMLNDEGEFEASVEFMRNLALTYPDVPTTELALYNLSQYLYEKAGQLESDEALKKATEPEGFHVTKQQLIERAAQQIQAFLALYPENVVCDEASFSLANAWVELAQFDKAIQWCSGLPARYPDSAFLDDFEYIQAYGHFLNAQFDDALKLCEKLATAKYPQPDKSLAPSGFQTLALYIAGQVYHSQGRAADAIKYYERVAEKFADAKEAIEYFRQKGVHVPEVTIVHGAGPVTLKLSARNVPTAELQVYKVDLLKFYQMHRSLKGLAQMNLAGIKPLIEQAVTLTGGETYLDKETPVTLDLKDKGAYFVVLKAEGASGSGIVLRTDLDLEVQEEADSGRVRVNVVNKTTDGYEPKASVWVVGTGNKEFTKGETDLRGLLIADDIKGTATVIASKGEQYAFHRGTTVLQPESAEGADKAKERDGERKEARKKADAPADFKQEALNELATSNRAIQGRRRGQLEEQFKGGGFGGQAGVQVQQAF
jgi:uncharacterized protein YfaS (alpha-2-macroglobulin family)/TolA-binding protein